eukprot:6842276-Prymnesium_polylepis.1
MPRGTWLPSALARVCPRTVRMFGNHVTLINLRICWDTAGSTPGFSRPRTARLKSWCTHRHVKRCIMYVLEYVLTVHVMPAPTLVLWRALHVRLRKKHPIRADLGILAKRQDSP